MAKNRTPNVQLLSLCLHIFYAPVRLMELHLFIAADLLSFDWLCSQKGHFKGMPFHHVIKHYVIQGGHSQGLGAAEDWTTKVKIRSRLATRFFA